MLSGNYRSANVAQTDFKLNQDLSVFTVAKGHISCLSSGNDETCWTLYEEAPFKIKEIIRYEPVYYCFLYKKKLKGFPELVNTDLKCKDLLKITFFLMKNFLF